MKASEYVKRGWCQHHAGKDSEGAPLRMVQAYGRVGGLDGAVEWCASGAIYAAADNIDEWDASLTLLGASMDIPAFLVARWNDHPDRTQDEVVAALEAAGL
jgi:hypothetical protein